MALGTLSSDQERYAATVAQQTGLDPTVVRAWIGAESGWGTYNAGHNYLNVGPGRQYPSVDQAAAYAAQLVNNSSKYAGIRSAIPQGAGAQVTAIGSSPWGTNAGDLAAVYQGLVGQGGAPPSTAGGAGSTAATTAGFSINPLDHLPSLSNLSGGIASATGLDKVASTFISGMLSLVFVAGAIGLIGLGLARLTGNNPRDVVKGVQGTVTTAGQAASLAAL